MSRSLNIGAALLFVTTVIGIVVALQYLFTVPFDEALLGSTLAQIRSFNANVMDTMTLVARLSGLYLLTTALLGIFILALPFRKGEKWAWYAVLVVIGLGLFGQFALIYAAGALMASYIMPIAVLLIVFWAAGLAVSAKESLK
jgi:hypothetical protein